MYRRVILAALMILVTGGAAALRLDSLDNRPMHCDEANQAVRFGRQVLAEGRYDYDPYEHHGPTLSFFTLPVARAAGAKDLTQLTETHVRLVPALFGILLVALVWMLRDELGYVATLCAGVLAAISPAMVFYSRYYIQEMLLVFFTFAAMVALWRFARAAVPRTPGAGATVAFRSAKVACSGEAKGDDARPSPTFAERKATAARSMVRQGVWLVLLGVSIGLMHASKETCVLALFSMTVAAALTVPGLPWGTFPTFRRPQGTFETRLTLRRLALSGLVVVLVAAGTSALVYSSFGKSWEDVGQSYTAYWHYLDRASGQGSAGDQPPPAYHYLRVLFAWHQPGGPFWTEGAVALLAVAGIVAAFGKGDRSHLPRSGPEGASHKWDLSPFPPMARFLAVYTVLMTLIYSAIPYKTPWCALGFLHGMILLAGIGAAALVRLAPGIPAKVAVIALLVAAAGHLAWEAHRASFSFCADPNNPYAYVPTTEDVPRLAEQIRQIAAAAPDGKAMPIQLICPDNDYWPLPWYLRDFENLGGLDRIPRGPAAPLIVTQPSMDEPLAEYLYVTPPPGQRYMYVPLAPDGEDRDWRLRPDTPLHVYVRYRLWQAHQQRREPAPAG